MIDSYDFGIIVIDGKRYTSDVIIFQDHINDNWWRKEGHRLGIEDIGEIIDAKPDVLIIGTGHSGLMRVPEETRGFIESKGIEMIIEKTKEACERYNNYKKSGLKRVVAALHLTC